MADFLVDIISYDILATMSYSGPLNSLTISTNLVSQTTDNISFVRFHRV